MTRSPTVRRTQRLRIKHPSRTRAYSPRLRHNGTGAWSAETEQPLYWDDVTLFQRLSPTAARLQADQASRLLALTDMPVAAVARAVGFTDPANFSKFFQRQSGQTPGSFRRQLLS